LIILFPPAKHDFNNYLLLQAFALKAAIRAVIVVHSSNDLSFFIDRTFRGSTSSFLDKLKLNSALPFFLATVGEGASQVD